MKKIILMHLILTFFVSCAVFTTAPEYQRIEENGMHRVGYESSKIVEGKYHVRYLHDSKLTFKGFLRRSAEIAIENKKAFFCVNESKQGREKDINVDVGGGVTKNIALDEYSGVITLKDSSTGESCYNAKEVFSGWTPKND
ncbi:MAG: hypothetical protein JNM93_00170 [Bacteriovoracaceae bacterium]|nr:hypothetical protein [Bacteriovoracaceae bacterium]